MKKLLLMFAAVALAAQTTSAQTVEDSKFFDNWYLGVNTGLNSKTTHTAIFKNLNPSAGLRIGRYFTPVFGFAIEGEAYFNNKASMQRPLGTFVKGTNVSLLGTTNFSNWFGGYTGEPRLFEVIGVYGLGWGHVFSTESADVYERNAFTSKLGLDFAFNLGARKDWQVYIEPNITYALDNGTKTQFNVDRSALGVLVGVNYKFANSNGTHNFKIAELHDQAEIDGLNDRINRLRAANEEKEAVIANDRNTIADLQAQLAAAKQQKPTVVVKKDENVLQPTVIFRQGKSNIDAAQYASVSMVATYMKNHKDARILIKGYASPEGSKELNQKLSEARANAVKDALVKRYGVAASRISVRGMGATDELFDEVDFNRVVTFTDISKQ